MTANGFRELDDLVLHLKGLVLVRDLRRQRGAATDELDLYGTEIERVREQLAALVRGATGSGWGLATSQP